MLSQMADKLDVRLHESSIDLQHLDITSYLSAPNRINTCNSHLGTVYRIFTDLSDMGWKEKHTPLYNLATHSMDKIVETFDPETGQVCKDDNGELKIRQVVDWPVSAGLTGEAEWKKFFKWADSLNNYHPQVMNTDCSKVPEGYHPLRYQTKAYDECTKCLSVFTQDEQEFLERYRWLRHVPEFFKPHELFSVLNYAEVEKEAVQKLQNFYLDNDIVRCPDASTLHALIPFVKRLVRLFPLIKENVKNQLSSPQIRHKVYQYETKRYVEKIHQSTLDFNIDALDLREFLESDQQIWQIKMIDGDAWTGLTKVYRVLQNTSCTPNYSSESNYTLLKLKRLLTVNRMTNLTALLAEMETPHLLMIACGTNQPDNGELENIFQETFNILKQKNTMKIILTTQSKDNTTEFIEELATETLGEGFITTDEQLIWRNLTPDSQAKLLGKEVNFQGKRVPLNQLTSVESMTDSFPLSHLLQESELKIGEEPVQPAGSDYNEKYYIERTFNHNNVIRLGILNDKREGKFADLLARTEQEFRQLCQQNPASNVHWLVEGESGELVWQQSQGKLYELRKYVDGQKSQSYAPSDFDKLLQQAKQHRDMIIADKAGMGKTTVLTHLSKQIKKKFPSHWLVRINLNDYTELLNSQKGKQMDKEKLFEFVSKEVLKLESHLEKELFEKSFKGNKNNKVVVMLDGFDEISPNYKETVLDMLQVLKQTSLEQLWVTTRPHLREELEDEIQQLSYTLQPFSEDEQVEFLKKFWLQTSNIEVTNQNRLQIYAEALIRNLAQPVSHNDKQFTGFPLQTRMLAEAFEEGFRSFYKSDKTQPELPDKLDLLDLYKRFIESKYYIYYNDKCRTAACNVGAKEHRERDIKNIQEEHQLLAIKTFLIKDQVAFVPTDDQLTLSDEELARIGIMQMNSEGKLRFIHRTFAEYLVADFIINQLTKKTKQHHKRVQKHHTLAKELLLNNVLLRTDCQVLKTFLDALLKKYKPLDETLKEYGRTLKHWNERDDYRRAGGRTTLLHDTAAGDNANIIGFLLDSLKSGEHSKVLTKMLLATDMFGRTAFHMAAQTDSVKALKRIWEWAEAVKPTVTSNLLLSRNTNELKKKLFLAKDDNGYIAWHYAAAEASLQALETLWMWSKEVKLNTDELLLARSRFGLTAFQLAAENNGVGTLQKLWSWAEEGQRNPNELKKKLFLDKQDDGYTAWQRAAGKGSSQALQTLQLFAKELELNTDELMPAENDNYSFDLELAGKLFVSAEENEQGLSELDFGAVA